MKRVMSYNDLISVIQRGDAYLRKGSIINLLDAEIEYNNRLWKVTYVGLFTVTLED